MLLVHEHCSRHILSSFPCGGTERLRHLAEVTQLSSLMPQGWKRMETALH